MHERDKRAKKEILKNVLRFRAKQKAHEERTTQILLRTARVTAIFLLILSFLLIVDCKFIPPKKTLDWIESVNMSTHKGSTTITLSTYLGKWMAISNTGYEEHMDSISYHETRIFKIVDNIVLLKNRLPIERNFNAIRLAPHFSIAWLLLSLLFLWLNPKHFIKEAVGTLIIAVFIVETVLLLI